MAEASTPLRQSRATRFFRHPVGLVASVVFGLIVLIALAAPWLAPKDPNFVDLMMSKAPPGGGYLLGGDATGRDILSRLIFGARTTLFGAAITIVTALLLGVPSGIVSGYFGRMSDRALSWVSDAIQAIPGMIILLVVAAGTRSNFALIMVTVGFIMAPGYFRIARSTTMALRGEDYITAARVAGLSHLRILRTHILPGIIAPIIIQTALAAGLSMGIQAGLQFLGIGDSNTPSWGAMMAEGFRFMLTDPWLLFWPSAALGVTIAALALIGSTLAEILRMPAAQAMTPAPVRAVTSATAPVGHYVATPETAAARVENLRVAYRGEGGEKEVIHGISFDVAPGEVLGIVGESGSGKSQTVFSLLDLLPHNGRYTTDGIWVHGRKIDDLTPKDRAKLLGSELGYVPQEPMSNLDPSFSIGFQLTEPLRAVHAMSRRAARDKAQAVLARVGIADVDRVMRAYPHQISGGMAQRVLIAGAILAEPSLLLADEPTTALDVTVQAEVLELLRELQADTGMSLVLVTHNFGVVADICDRVIVVRDGEILESGPVEEIFANARHPYTRELIAAAVDTETLRRDLDTQAGAHPRDHEVIELAGVTK